MCECVTHAVLDIWIHIRLGKCVCAPGHIETGKTERESVCVCVLGAHIGVSAYVLVCSFLKNVL